MENETIARVTLFYKSGTCYALTMSEDRLNELLVTLQSEGLYLHLRDGKGTLINTAELEQITYMAIGVEDNA